LNIGWSFFMTDLPLRPLDFLPLLLRGMVMELMR
jgi:hypothetical protein